MKYVAMILVGLVMGGVSLFLSWDRMRAADARVETVAYLALRADLGEPGRDVGDRLQLSDLTTMRVPAQGDTLGDLAFPDTPEMRQFVTLQPLVERLPRGRLLTRDMFGDEEEERLDQHVALGMRAVAIPVNAQTSINNQVVPGNRVDLIGVVASFSDPEARVLLEDVRVIAVGDAFSFEQFRAAGRRNYATMTIEVTPEEALELAAVRPLLEGPIGVTLRNQCDSAAADSPGCPRN
jgi:Flp pilus assembly protein CpaB